MKGHAYTPKNTYIPPRGVQFCRMCMSAIQKKYREQKKAKAKNSHPF
jgi:hypothetical protein